MKFSSFLVALCCAASAAALPLPDGSAGNGLYGESLCDEIKFNGLDCSWDVESLIRKAQIFRSFYKYQAQQAQNAGDTATTGQTWHSVDFLNKLISDLEDWKARHS